MREPAALVLRREEVMEETAKLVVVAWVVVEFPVTKRLPEMWSFSVGTSIPIPMLPVLVRILKAEVVVVAVPATVVVAKYKFPPAFLKAH